MSAYISEMGKMAAIAVPIFTAIGLVWKGLSKVATGYRWISRNCHKAMPEIEQSDPWWTARDQNPIFSRRR